MLHLQYQHDKNLYVLLIATKNPSLHKDLMIHQSGSQLQQMPLQIVGHESVSYYLFLIVVG